MKVQLGPEKQDKERSKDGKDKARRMKRRAFLRTCKHVSEKPADNRADQPEPYRPKQRQWDVHDRLRHEPCDQPDNDVPDEMKHTSSVLTF